jgi:hypothetical protein
MIVGIFMVNFLVSLPPNWEEFLENVADEHDIDIGKVIGELCNWAFSRAEYKDQFEAWLDKAYPKKGEAQDSARTKGEEAGEREEELQIEQEEETHEDRDYSEDREVKH